MGFKTTSIPARVLVLASVAALLLAGCGGGDASSSAPEPILIQPTQATAATEPEAKLASYNSTGLDVTFSYPEDWKVKEDGNIISLSSPTELDSEILFADVTYEISLFLAGRSGSLVTSAVALMEKYAGMLVGDSQMMNYSPESKLSTSNQVSASSVFSFDADGSAYEGFVGVAQVGGRMFAILYVCPDDARKDTVDAIYNDMVASLDVRGADVPLEAADLSDLGFPDAPRGYYRFYNPVTGQFFFYPQDWDLTSEPDDAFVAMVNDEGAIMLSRNWTKSFYPLYNSNNSDLEECFDVFLGECLETLEDSFGVASYSDFQLLRPEGKELIKAAFNFRLEGGGTLRCFAELAYRPYNGTDYIQGTMCMYLPGDKYSIDYFSIIMDSTLIRYPEL